MLVSRREAETLLTRFRLVVPFTLLVACSGESTTPVPPIGPVTFVVANDLIAPVTFSVDGSPYVILSSGRTTSITVSASSRLTWTSAKPADAQGQRIPDEIGDVRVNVAGLGGSLEITNVIGDQTYFTARIFNFTGGPVSIGVFDGTKVWCASLLPAATMSGPGFTVIGYYRLLPATELRAYTTTANCSGPYVTWPSSQITGLQANSGLLTLSLESTR
ncbi:MAG: hypothetical protein ACJ796_19660 [Gemmatimonadaceae bacterium]